MHWSTISVIAFALAASSSPLPAPEADPTYFRPDDIKSGEFFPVSADGSLAARSIPSMSLKRSADNDAGIDPVRAHVRSVNRAVKRHAKRAGIHESRIKRRSPEAVADAEWVLIKRDENGVEKRAPFIDGLRNLGQRIQEGADTLQRIKEGGFSIDGGFSVGGGVNIETPIGGASIGGEAGAGAGVLVVKRQAGLGATEGKGTPVSASADALSGELITATEKKVDNVELLANPSVTGAVTDVEFNPASLPDGTTKQAAPLNQDGNDIIYFSEISIGSEGKKFTVNMDTGSSDLWVPGVGSETSHSTLGSGDSSTLKVHKDKTFSITYGTGQVSGVLVQDKVTIAGMALQTTFGAGTTLSKDFNNFPADGILGLASSKSSQQRVPTPLEQLAANKQIKSALVGVHLQRISQGNNGVINFGEVDPNLIVGGTKGLNFNKNVNTRGQYECVLQDLTVNGKSLGIPKESTAIIDTGTTQMLLPPKVAMDLNSMLSPQAVHNNQGVYAVPCDTTTTVMVNFGGVSYPVSPKDYIGSRMQQDPNFCLTRIGAFNLGGGFGENVALFGDVFLKNVYSVYDQANNQVGFGVDKLNNGAEVNAAEYVAVSNGGPTPNENNSKVATSAASSVTSMVSRKAAAASITVALVLSLVL